VTLNVSPDEIIAEKSITFTVAISNQGEEAVDTPFQVGIYTTTVQEGQRLTKDDLDLERPLTTAMIESLAAGESISKSLEYKGFGEPGSYIICAFVDNGQQITEADEGNNIGLAVALEVKSAWAQRKVARFGHLYKEPVESSVAIAGGGSIVVYQIKPGTIVEVKEDEMELDTVKVRVEGWVPEDNIEWSWLILSRRMAYTT
jgi:hypothetical protein